MATQALFVASTGGHLEELKRLKRVVVDADTHVTWVTFDSPQSRSLLAGEADVRYVREVPPRGFAQLLRVLLPSLRILLRTRPDVVYSTGAAVALAFLPFAFLVGGRAVYIESATRTEGPSVTGRLLSFLPWVDLRTQYRSWAKGRWQYEHSVFDQWAPLPLTAPPVAIRKLVVTLGTQADFPFVSLVERLQEIVPPHVEVRWQVGAGFPAESRPYGARDVVPREELREWVREADAVVAHAGVGSAMTMLGTGRTPVLVPRSATRGEHVDEHQVLLAQELVDRGLAVASSPSELTWDDLLESTTVRVVRSIGNSGGIIPADVAVAGRDADADRDVARAGAASAA